MTTTQIAEAITAGKTALGIELGSTRIKAVLIGPEHSPIASGSYDWENRLENGIWTYRLEDAVAGIQSAYKALAEDARAKYGTELRTLGALGVSAMMHGYLPLDREGRQLAEFRTWRNTVTEEEAALIGSMMEGVVNNGTGGSVKSDFYQAAAKTGSAEFDAESETHAWLVGYAPADNPRVAVSIVLEKAGSGGTNAGPIAKKIFDAKCQ